MTAAAASAIRRRPISRGSAPASIRRRCSSASCSRVRRRAGRARPAVAGRRAPVAKPTTVTVTAASGETVTGVLVALDDFNVALRDPNGVYRSWKRTRRPHRGEERSVRRAHRAARQVHGQEHARHRGLPGVTEMRRPVAILLGTVLAPRCSAVSLLAQSASLAPDAPAPRRDEADADARFAERPGHAGRLVADLQRRLLGTPIQSADEDQRHNVTAMSLAWVYRVNTGQGFGPAIKGTPVDDRRHPLLHGARSRLGHRRAFGPRDLASHLGLEGRRPHRQSRRRHPQRHAVFRDARLSSRRAQRATTARRSGASRSATSTSSTTRRSRR